MDKTYDVIVAGAGPAGCAAALTLAGAGRRVLVLERAVFPREKVCGDGITGGSLKVLDRLGVLPYLANCPHTRISKVQIVSPSGHVLRADLRETAPGIDPAWGLPRKQFDAALAAYVRDLPAVSLREGVTVTGLLRRTDGSICGVKAGLGETHEELYAPLVIGADGAHSRIAAEAGLRNTDPRHRAFAVRACYEKVVGLSDTVVAYYDDTVAPGYGWIIPNGETTANVGVGLYQRYAPAGAARRIFDNFIGNNALVARHLEGSRMLPGTLRGWPLLTGTYPAARARGNVLLCGDAGSFVEPVGGEGVYFALQSGILAGRAADQSLQQNRPQKAGLLYERSWRRTIKRSDYVPGRIIQYCMSHRFLLDRCIRLMSRKQSRADLFAQAVSHNIPKSKLIRLFF